MMGRLCPLRFVSAGVGVLVGKDCGVVEGIGVAVRVNFMVGVAGAG
jgi:hypothetical protein